MTIKKVKVAWTTTDEFGVEVSSEVEIEGSITLQFQHERPIVPSSTFMGGAATFTTTGVENFKLELVSKTAPTKV